MISYNISNLQKIFTLKKKQTMETSIITSVYREKKHPYDCFTDLSEDKSILMTALWCPEFSNHG